MKSWRIRSIEMYIVYHILYICPYTVLPLGGWMREDAERCVSDTVSEVHISSGGPPGSLWPTRMWLWVSLVPGNPRQLQTASCKGTYAYTCPDFRSINMAFGLTPGTKACLSLFITFYLCMPIKINIYTIVMYFHIELCWIGTLCHSARVFSLHSQRRLPSAGDLPAVSMSTLTPDPWTSHLILNFDLLYAQIYTYTNCLIAAGNKRRTFL